MARMVDLVRAVAVEFQETAPERSKLEQEQTEVAIKELEEFATVGARASIERLLGYLAAGYLCLS